MGALQAAAQVVHFVELGERVSLGEDVDLEAHPRRVGHAVVGEKPGQRGVLLPFERRQVRHGGIQRSVIRQPIWPVARPDRVGDDSVGRVPALKRAPVRQEV